MRNRFKKFLYNNLCFVNCLIFLLLFIFMANGYSLLKSRLNLNGKNNISEEAPWLPKISFQMTKRLGNIFFYNIIIENDSNLTYKDWKITMNNSDYINFTDMLER